MPTTTTSWDRIILPTYPNLTWMTTCPWMLLDQMPTPTCCLDTEKWTRRP